ncbi:hypothetical protein F5Y10DRAFT_208431 [Nemania abortiva]|nr:hypothetical protein F5Y10DRAFT_208431 [Nemania abortiva]
MDVDSNGDGDNSEYASRRSSNTYRTSNSKESPFLLDAPETGHYYERQPPQLRWHSPSSNLQHGRGTPPFLMEGDVHFASKYTYRQTEPFNDDYQPSKSGAAHVIAKGTRRRGRNIQMWWLEIVLCFTMIGALFAIVGTLFPHQNQPTPQLPSWTSVNSLVAIEIVIMKLVIATIASQGLGQLKWRWYYKNSRPLSDLAVFDSASRGIFGAIKLVWLLRGRGLLASMGALVLIISTIIDPFGQEIIRFYQCSILEPSARATINTTNFISAGLGPLSTFVSSVSLPMQVEIQKAIFDSTNQAQMKFDCLSGNCTFTDTYKTMGFCNRCSDISDRVKIITLNTTATNYTLPQMNLTLGSGIQTGSFSMGSGTDGDIDKLAFYSIAAWSKNGSKNTCDSATPDSWACKGFGAAVCTIKPCVQSKRAVISLNRLYETAAAPGAGVWAQPEVDQISRTIDMSCANATERAALQRQGYRFDSNTDWIAFNASWRAPASTIYETIRRKCVFEYSTWDIYVLTSFMYDYFAGTAVTGYPTFIASIQASTGPIQLVEIFNNGSITFESYASIFDRIANAMEVFSRENPRGDSNFAQSAGSSDAADQVFGDVYYTRTCIQVRWQWLAFPAALCLLTLLFFVGMVIETRWLADDEGTWHDYKTDTLPLLFHGLERHVLDNYHTALASSSSVSEVARTIHVRFDRADGSWKFVEAASITAR